MTSKRAWVMAASASVLLVMLVAIGLVSAGFRFFVVKTPSMATTAPVGTLVVVQPQASYAVGDIISYRRGSLSVTHRIVGETWQGWVTKGDLNAAPDPLPVSASQVIGTVVHRVPYLGFLVEALPWLILGWAIVYGISLLPRIAPLRRWQVRLVGWSLVASAVGLWQRPWVDMVMIGYVADGSTGVDMHLVNTGIFPVKVLGTVLTSGQDAVVRQDVVDASGRYSVTPHLALSFWWFLLLLAICLIPVLASLVVKGGPAGPLDITPLEPATAGAGLRRRVSEGRLAHALVVLASVVAVSLVLQSGTQSSLSSVIQGSTNAAGARTWFTCQGAEVGTSKARFVWGLTSTTNPQPDLTSNGRAGTFTTVKKGTAATASTSSPCPRDTKGSVTFNGATCLSTQSTVVGTETYSEEIWFRTTNVSLNGKLIGFADNITPANQSHYDRHVYLDPSGRVVFGVYSGGQAVVSSAAGRSYADGVWHHVVAASAPGSIALYVDGSLVGSRNDTAGQDVSFAGYWQVGCGQLDGWQDATGTARAFGSYFTGNLRLAAVYDVTLSATQVREHYLAGTA